MMRFSAKCLLIVLITMLTACASAPKASDAQPVDSSNRVEESGAVEVENEQEKPGELGGLDARLSNYKYPYPVEIFAFESQRQPLEMAYMDVKPDAANGQVVVLLHCKNFSGAYWKRTIESLLAEGYRVVVPDQIGFGKSSKPVAFQFSFQELATQTVGLLDKLGVENAHIVSHSMGGMLGARFALMFPARTTSLTLVNPIRLE